VLRRYQLLNIPPDASIKYFEKNSHQPGTGTGSFKKISYQPGPRLNFG